MTKRKTARRKKVHADGELVFRSKAMLDYHLRLKKLKEEKKIKSFYVPVENEIKKTKYNSVKVEIDGHLFDSMMESMFYLHLLEEKEKGNISEIELQPKFVLLEGFRKYGKKIREISYRADFLVNTNEGKQIVYDVKGYVTKDFGIRRKLFDYNNPDLDLILTKYRAREKSWEYF